MNNLWSFVLFCSLSPHSKGSGTRQMCQDAFISLGAEQEQIPADRKSVHSTTPLFAPCSVWDNSLCARRDFWWSLDVAKLYSRVMVRKRGEKKSSLGKKLQRENYWHSTEHCAYFLNSPATLGVYYSVIVGIATPSWAHAIFCIFQISRRTLRAHSVTSQGQILLCWVYWWQWDMGTCNSQKSTKALQKNHILTLLVMLSAHMLSSPLIIMGYLQCSSYLQRRG